MCEVTKRAKNRPAEDNSGEKPAEINRVVYNDMIKGDRLVLVAEEEGVLLV